MPSRKNRNANPPSLSSNVYPAYTHSLVPQLDTSSPSVWPPEQIHEPHRPPDKPDLLGVIEPEVERVGAEGIEEHILDVEHEYGRVTSHDTPPAHSTTASPSQLHTLLLSADDEAFQSSPGHVRSPVLAREPTMLESFSRTLRTYVPSSIHIPAAAPSPPLVSRPVSFGSFMLSPANANSNATINATHPTAGAKASHRGSMRIRGGGQVSPSGVSALDDISGFEGGPFGSEEPYDSGEEDQDAFEGLVHRQVTVYPTVDEGDAIVFSRWDTMKAGSVSRRLLLVGYNRGFQIWDCTNLASVSEILNLSGSAWGTVTFAAMLGSPRLHSHTYKEALKDERPLVGIVSRTGDRNAFFVYSLCSHRVVKHFAMHDVASFVSNEWVTVVSTTNPPTLHILSSSSLAVIHTIPASSISAFTYPAPTSTINLGTNLSITPTITSPSKAHTNSVLLDSPRRNSHSRSYSRPQSRTYAHRDDSQFDHPGSPHLQQYAGAHSPSRPHPSEAHGSPATPTQHTVHPQPIYALSHRLLAFASPAPTSHAPPIDATSIPSTLPTPVSSPGVSPSPPLTAHHRRSSSSASAFGLSQAELGSAALKVGGSVLSGMKSLGGFAYNAATEYAKSRGVPGLGQGQPSGHTSGGRHIGGGRQAGSGSMLFSRSAPAATSSSELSNAEGETGTPGSPSLGAGRGVSTSKGSYVTVLDLAPILGISTGKPKDSTKKGPLPIAHFAASKHQPVAHLAFTSDGTSLVVSPRDGQVGRMFQLRPSPALRKRYDGAGGVGEGVWHVYNLRRGRTSAVVEDLEVSMDGRWVALGTRKRTVHIFAVNPYGGNPDHRSHVDGRVMNVQELQPLSTDVTPLVRLRAIKAPSPDRTPVPLAFTFLAPTSSVLPSSLSPSADEYRQPHHSRRPTNFQDVLIFDPSDGVLSLRRITLEQRPREHSLASLGTSISFPGTSISLPGVGASGRLGAPPLPPKTAVSAGGGGRASGLTQMMEATSMELVGKESVVATWQLRRQQAWGVIRTVIKEAEGGATKSVVQGTGAAGWLAQAELSTSSRSPRILPRSVYLTHQFSFHTLGEDYHALIRQYHLDISGSPISVRRAVEISAYTGGSGGVGGVLESESFIEGFASSARHHSLITPSSFDEPLASALSDGLEHPSRAPPIPMLPNGTLGSNPRSFKGSIPIRNMAAGMAEGMSEGFGRIRREVYKVRSPRLGPRSDGSLSAGSGSGSGGRISSGHVNLNVPLEFDEEDEDFIGEEGTLGPGERAREIARGDGLDVISRSTSRGESHSGASASVSTPSTGTNLLESEHRDHHGTHDNLTLGLGGADGGEDDLWTGWSVEDKQAIDEAEQFDDVVGFLDEEQTPGVQAERRMRRR